MAGGGGSTGEVSFPTHMEDIHKDWLGYSAGATPITTDFISVMETALVTNPLDSMSYSDPATDITALETEYGELGTMIDALDDSADWQTIVDAAVTKLDAAGVLQDVDMATLISDALTSTDNSLDKAVTKALSMIDSKVVVQAITEFRRNRKKVREEMKTQYKAGMANINAERSSAYALGLALLEIDFERELGQYQSEISLQMYQQGVQYYAQILATQIDGRLRAALTEKQNRDQLLSQSVTTILQYKQFTVEMKKVLTTVLAEVNRINFIMDSEYTANTADLNWKHSSWDMTVYKNAINVLGGIGGSQFVPDGPTKAQSAIGGALSGAGTGAAIGTALGGPGIGTAVGATLGLAAGLFG